MQIDFDRSRILCSFRVDSIEAFFIHAEVPGTFCGTGEFAMAGKISFAPHGFRRALQTNAGGRNCNAVLV
jgi:hypothetical protein